MFSILNNVSAEMFTASLNKVKHDLHIHVHRFQRLCCCHSWIYTSWKNDFHFQNGTGMLLISYLKFTSIFLQEDTSKLESRHPSPRDIPNPRDILKLTLMLHLPLEQLPSLHRQVRLYWTWLLVSPLLAWSAHTARRTSLLVQHIKMAPWLGSLLELFVSWGKCQFMYVVYYCMVIINIFWFSFTLGTIWMWFINQTDYGFILTKNTFQ